MIKKKITYMGQPATMGCDGKCNKAWGINGRPRNYFVDENTHPDDYEWLSDQELGEAPVNPGTYEGGQGKPWGDAEKLNKWCARECERCEITEIYKPNEPLELSNFNRRISNCNTESTLLKEEDLIRRRFNKKKI